MGHHHHQLLPYIFILCLLAVTATAQVPAASTFRYTLRGQLESKTGEYDATYRPVAINGTHPRSFYTYPFRLCFYNTTPEAAVLAISAGVPNDLSPVRWVWEANRHRPVRENSVLSLGSDGNLALSDADGRVAWQTNTAGKGVSGIQLLPDGNLVLHDTHGRFVWQSFDHPTDTILVGQSLKVNGTNRLVARSSDKDASPGAYSVALDQNGFSAYVDTRSGRLQYGGWQGSDFGAAITFKAVTEYDNETASELVLAVNQYHQPPSPGRRLLQIAPTREENRLVLNKLAYNATYSFFRIGSDGNLRAFTYHDAVSTLRWRESFAFFSDYFVSECQLPSTCGGFGVCDRGMCVACPTPQGLQGWSEGCSPPTAPPCRGGVDKAAVGYYRVVGVEHFLTPFARNGDGGTVMMEECRRKCSGDCKCLGYVFDEEESSCLLVPYWGTLRKTQGYNGTVAYIKYSK